MAPGAHKSTDCIYLPSGLAPLPPQSFPTPISKCIPECVMPSRYHFVSLIELWQLGDYFLVPNMCDDALKKLRKNLGDAADELLRILPKYNKGKINATTMAKVNSERYVTVRQ
ncbi:hypothetical protein F5Y05DRAFT_74851 [Hypoxylon sp. FL0543]|nr:hypothetical protein F5Y05DRAFT_74851 [Hypoxylon sp. FL0543]